MLPRMPGSEMVLNSALGALERCETIEQYPYAHVYEEDGLIVNEAQLMLGRLVGIVSAQIDDEHREAMYHSSHT